MALPDVSTTWNGARGGGATAGLSWARVGAACLAVMFRDAFNERVAATRWDRGPWTGTGGRPRPSDVSTPSAYEFGPSVGLAAAPWWADLQGRLGYPPWLPAALPGLYAEFRETAAGGWEAQAGGPATLAMDPAWLRRKFFREIYTLSQAGADGQVARFCVYLGTPFCQSRQANPFDAFPSAFTPEAERHHAGKLFVRVAGVWVESPDQSLLPDLVELTGYACPGDVVGPWVAEDLRALFNLMRVTFMLEEPTGSPHSPFGLLYHRITIAAPGDAFGHAGGAFDLAWETGVGRRNHGPDPYRFDDGWLARPAAFEDAHLAVATNGLYWHVRTRYRVYSDRLPDPPPGGRSCLGRGYVRARRYISGAASPGSAEAAFDAFGDPVEQDTWTAMGAAVTASRTISTPPQGNLDDKPDGDGIARGYMGTIALWADWGVPGGFKFSALSE